MHSGNNPRLLSSDLISIQFRFRLATPFSSSLASLMGFQETADEAAEQPAASDSIDRTSFETSPVLMLRGPFFPRIGQVWAHLQPFVLLCFLCLRHMFLLLFPVFVVYFSPMPCICIVSFVSNRPHPLLFRTKRSVFHRRAFHPLFVWRHHSLISATCPVFVCCN